MAATKGFEPLSLCLTGTHLTVRPSSNVASVLNRRFIYPVALCGICA